MLLILAVVLPSPVHSAPCLEPCATNQNFVVQLPGKLDSTMFSKSACLVDPSVDCRLANEFFNRNPAQQGLAANAWSNQANSYCDSCFLYFTYCATPQGGTIAQGPLAFVTNGKSPVSPTEHALLHMHVGLITSGVKPGLADGYKWAKGQKPNPATSFLIACTKGTAVQCTFDASKQMATQNTIRVTIKSGAAPSAVQPFNTVYGPIAPTAPNDATKFNSMAVVAPAANEWLVLQLLNGAAECLLPDAESFGKCSL
uniref:CHRD domain-containing protein n=1 Tax=Tetradesmus obliquus TaxID=3088 RepID=A0A383VGE6_TETOB|eukprot:jgi/Sobl393_1/15897/SZX63812.1